MKTITITILSLLLAVPGMAAPDAARVVGDLKVDGIHFSAGGVLTSAPKDGKSVLNGSGAPSITGNIGDFYLDTTNNRLYGPYNGTWGAGVSLVGPKGDTGLQGPAGPSLAGNIFVSAGFHNWKPFNSSDPLSFAYLASLTRVSSSIIASSYISINPDLTTVLYGKSVLLKGVQFCFNTQTNTTLNSVELNTYSHTSGVLIGSRNRIFLDPIARTGNTCMLYTPSTPALLTVNDGANFFINVNFSAANSTFEIGRTTFILESTETIAANP